MEKGSRFIMQLRAQGKMIDGQALEHSGVLLEKKDNLIIKNALNRNSVDVMSYIRITTGNLDEAVEIAKYDPRFDQPGWKIEVRQILA